MIFSFLRNPTSRVGIQMPTLSILGPPAMEPPTGLFPSKADIGRLVTVVAIASCVAFACALVAKFLNSSTKPFCDSTMDSLDYLSDSCQPCPDSGECYGGILECNYGYKRKGDLCAQDGDIDGRTRELSEWIEARLCEAHAQHLCSSYSTASSWVIEDDIWSDLGRHKLMENLEYRTYNYLKEKTEKTIQRVLETRNYPNGTKDFKCPDSLAEHYKPFACHLKQWALDHILVLMPSCILLLGFAFLCWKVHHHQYISARVEELYLQVCDILEESALATIRFAGESNPWVVASWLRDHLLLPTERKDPLIWRKVEELVQEDSRIDRYPKLVKGESKVVWEWQAEGLSTSLQAKRRGEVQRLKYDDSRVNSKEKHREQVASVRMRWRDPTTVTKLFD